MIKNPMRHYHLFSIFLPLIFLGVGCLGGGSSVVIRPITLEYWRAEDDASSLQEIIDAYQKIHPNVTIEYKEFRMEDYDTQLLEALAEDRGPDIFNIPNVWLGGWLGKIEPMPEETEIPTQVVNQKRQIVTVNQRSATPSIGEVIRDYVEVVAGDIIVNVPVKKGEKPKQVIIGLPYSADTMAMFYNIDLFKKVNIEEPPSTWRDVQENGKKLTALTDDGGVRQSGAAVGLAENIKHHTELLSVLMMQNGANMAAENGLAKFDKSTFETKGRTYPPGVEALIYYRSFAVDGTRYFMWDDEMPNSLDAFITGKTAMYFGFPTDMHVIRERAPKLNFEMAQMPQIDPSKVRNLAQYPIEVVSRKTAYVDEAWDFLIFASRPDQVTKYLNVTKRPTALRSLISSQLEVPDAKPFVSQVLTAESWYKGKDYDVVEDAFATMINTPPDPLKPDYQPIIAEGIKAINTTFR